MFRRRHLHSSECCHYVIKIHKLVANGLSPTALLWTKRKYDHTVDGFILVGTNFRGFNKNDTFVGFKIHSHSIFFQYPYRKLPFRGYWNLWIGPSTKTTKIGTPQKLSNPQYCDVIVSTIHVPWHSVVISPPPVKPKGTIGLHSVCQSVQLSVRLSVHLSVRHTRFLDFSWLCFDTSGWKLVASFHMKSYRSTSTSITIDQLFHELLPFVQNLFSRLLSAMLSHIWMKVGSKLPYEELQIKFDFHHGWPSFSWVTKYKSAPK